MVASKVTNVGANALTLPHPFHATIAPGKSVLVPGMDTSEVIGALGGWAKVRRLPLQLAPAGVDDVKSMQPIPVFAT